MTEAGEKWAEGRLVGYLHKIPYLPDHIAEAEFWLRAFCDEVMKRAEVNYQARALGKPLEDCIRKAFLELKDELLGEDK